LHSHLFRQGGRVHLAIRYNNYLENTWDDLEEVVMDTL